MENEGTVSFREKISLDFTHLPAFAKFVLHQELEHFASELVRLYVENDIPILRFFTSMGNEQRMALVTAFSREMLTMIASNNADQHISQSVQNWLHNQVPMIRREHVQAQDIALVNHVRGKVFRSMIPRYTNDPVLSLQIVEELEQYLIMLDWELSSAYMELQEREIKGMNAALEKREHQLLEAQEIGQIGSFDCDLLRPKESSFTPQVFKILEVESLDIRTLFHDIEEIDREKISQAMTKAFVDGIYEGEHCYKKNNKEKTIYVRGRVEFNDGRPVRMVGTIMDVTDRHHIINKLRESESLYMQAQALTHIGNWSWVIDEQSITWSDEMYRIYGLPPQSEVITLERFLAFIHPDDREKRVAQIQKSLATLAVEEYHFRIIAADGHEKILRGKGEMVADQHGKPRVMLGTCQDVTREFRLTRELRNREQYLEKLNQSLLHANQDLSRSNEELESFNFIASHDLQEPLRKIQVYSNRILENGICTLPDSLQDYFKRINNASSRMQKLIDDFLFFSQTFSHSQIVEDIDMEKMLAEIKIELNTRIEEKHAQVIVGELPHLHGVPFQIKQLMTNLISNALKYTEVGVPPQISISGALMPGSDVSYAGADPKIIYAQISVADKGIGFEEKYKAKIFELFQRLHSKNAYSGTGIGLALCKKIVQNMRGFITVESEPGKGSVFTVYLPVRPNEDQLRE
jgi:PAS domain S-box-containing protein